MPESCLWERMVDKKIISSAVFVILYLKSIIAIYGLMRLIPQSMWINSAGSSKRHQISEHIFTNKDMLSFRAVRQTSQDNCPSRSHLFPKPDVIMCIQQALFPTTPPSLELYHLHWSAHINSSFIWVFRLGAGSPVPASAPTLLYPFSGTSSTPVCLLLPYILLVTSVSSLIAELGTTITSKIAMCIYMLHKVCIIAMNGLRHLHEISYFLPQLFLSTSFLFPPPVNISVFVN